jgi:hypothetical protein
MPANRFAPDRIVRGHEQDARIIDRILQAILARWPIRKCDVESVYSAAIDWSDGAQVPTSNINVDEIFNNATGIARALGCMDFINGLEVNYVDGDNISISPGHLLHRGDFKELECDVDNNDLPFTVAAAAIVDTTECAPTEGNPSGLDADLWYYVYANMDASGAAPPVADFIRISAKAPVKCEAKGWEHPTNNFWRFLGTIRTMDTGVIRPFDRRNNGWVYWRTALVATDWVAAGYKNSGTNLPTASGGWVKYTEAVTTIAYHNGDKHIPPSADLCCIAAMDNSSGDAMQARPVGDAGEGFDFKGSSDENSSWVVIPVNPPNGVESDQQTFEWKDPNGNEEIDVTGYHERIS